MLIEVCAYSVEDCLAAGRGGAGRIELCAGRAEGGITPSLGLIRAARAATALPLFVMIRPRGGDFVYFESELAVMEADIEAARTAGADGFVLGLLRPDGSVDAERTQRLLQRTQALPVTFHRAFDLCRDPHEALNVLIGLGIQTVLTSGQRARAADGVALLRALVAQAGGRIGIMAGAGVNAQNASLLSQTGVAALHLSGSTVTDSPMQFRREGVPMATATPGEYERTSASEAVIRAVQNIVAGL
jgi:copper homeostasis protein